MVGRAVGFRWKSPGTHPQGREMWHRRVQSRESGRGAAAGSWTDGVKPRTPAPSSQPFHHTVPLRICSSHFSARKYSDALSFKPWNSSLALLAFSNSPWEKVVKWQCEG